MKCPRCLSNLEAVLLGGSLIIDRCSRCEGVWLDQGEISFLMTDKKALETYSKEGLSRANNTLEKCPRCQDACLRSGFIPGFKYEVDECPKCKGLWLDGHEFKKLNQSHSIQSKSPPPLAKKKVVLRSLPSLGVSSLIVLGTLYTLLFTVTVFLVEAGFVTEKGGIGIVLGFVTFQFVLSPILMDWSLSLFGSLDWIEASQLPPHLQTFFKKVCEQYQIPEPQVGLIGDGTPQAFTYGRTPRSARLVLSRGLIEILTPEELEAVVAHELGHVYHWDFLWMTLAQVVPILLYQLYRIASRNRRSGGNQNKGKSQLMVAALVAYVAYWISQWIVLLLSRVREYWADRFSVDVTRNPKALVSALSKVAYGLVASDQKSQVPDGNENRKSLSAVQSFGILNINQSKGVALYAVQGLGEKAQDIKDIMQWDLWNPWASYYEFQSTHPLIAKRILAISNQALHMGLEPPVIFDEKKPENYWDDFFADLVIVFLPFIVGSAFVMIRYLLPGDIADSTQRLLLGVPFLVGCGVGGLIKTFKSFPSGPFVDSVIISLLKKIKVSPVSSYPVRLKGTVMGRGKAGNIFSEDMVFRDETGMIFLDFQHGLSNFYFALFKWDEFKEKEVVIEGWYRRAPIPYIELKNIESKSSRAVSYSYYYRLLGWIFICLLGFGIQIWM